MCIHYYSKWRKTSWLGRGILTQKLQSFIFQLKKGFLTILAILFPTLKAAKKVVSVFLICLKPLHLFLSSVLVAKHLHLSWPWQVCSSLGMLHELSWLWFFLIGIIASHFYTVSPNATLLLKAVKGSQGIRRRIKYNLQTTSPLHSYVIAHSVCDLEHANLTLSPQPQSHNHSSSNYSISCIA